MINLEFDCAGVSWNLAEAINELTGHTATHVVRDFTYCATHTHKQIQTAEEVAALAEEYDVLHFNQWLWTHKPKGADRISFLPRSDYSELTPFDSLLKRKKVFFHFHGGKLQLNPTYWVNECKANNVRMFKCDPVTPIPGARWMPNITTVSPLFDVAKSTDKLLAAVHGSPDDPRRINGLIRDAMEYLRDVCRLPIEFKFFGGMPYDECIRERRNYHVSIDSLSQGFVGMWSFESLAMGQVVLSNVCPKARAYYNNFGSMDCPIVPTFTIDEMANNIIRLCYNRQELEEVGYKSLQWIRTCYDRRRIVERYIDEYEN